MNIEWNDCHFLDFWEDSHWQLLLLVSIPPLCNKTLLCIISLRKYLKYFVTGIYLHPGAVIMKHVSFSFHGCSVNNIRLTRWWYHINSLDCIGNKLHFYFFLSTDYKRTQRAFQISQCSEETIVNVTILKEAFDYLLFRRIILIPRSLVV